MGCRKISVNSFTRRSFLGQIVKQKFTIFLIFDHFSVVIDAASSKREVSFAYNARLRLLIGSPFFATLNQIPWGRGKMATKSQKSLNKISEARMGTKSQKCWNKISGARNKMGTKSQKCWNKISGARNKTGTKSQKCWNKISGARNKMGTKSQKCLNKIFRDPEQNGDKIQKNLEQNVWPEAKNPGTKFWGAGRKSHFNRKNQGLAPPRTI